MTKLTGYPVPDYTTHFLVEAIQRLATQLLGKVVP